MKLEVKDVPKKLLPLFEKLKQYKTLLFIVSLALIFGFLIMKINTYAQIEPTEDAINEKLTNIQRPKIDANALAKIQQLEDQNVEVKSLFEQARDNPFSEGNQ